MTGSKLIYILKTLSAEEMKLLEKFAASPYHFNGKNCSPLLKLLRKYYPGFQTDKITYEILYQKLYPGKKYNKQVMWNLTSALEKMTKEFLVQTALKKNKFIKTGFLLSEYSRRKILNNYPQALGEMENLLESGGIGYDYFDNKVRLENYKQEYFHMIDKIQPMSDSKLKAAEYQILLFLRMTVGGLNDMNLLSRNYNSRFDVNIPLELAKNLDLEKIAEYAHKNNFEYSFLIEIYYHSLMMLLKPGQIDHLEKVRKLYGIHFDKFTLSEKRNMMHWIVNCSLANLDFDEKKYRRIIFELNELRLKEGLAYYPEDQLPRAIYIQILNAAIAVNETAWADYFIKNYTSKLQPDIRDTMRRIANAILHFHTKEYRKVLKTLSRADFADMEDKFLARTLTARSYYELNEIESLLNYIDSSKHFLVNNPQVSEISRIYIHSFFNYLNKIIYIRENDDNDEIHVLKTEIEKNNALSNKKWLLEKLNELETKK